MLFLLTQEVGPLMLCFIIPHKVDQISHHSVTLSCTLNFVEDIDEKGHILLK